jgi:hypothetical protein
MAAVPRWVRLARRARTSSIVGPLVRATEGVLGPLDRTYEHRLTTRSVGLDELARHCPPSEESPIVILGVGWRSGTTLLQRLVVAGGDALVWGEPWHRCKPVRTLAEQGRAVSPDWLGHLPDVGPGDGDLGGAWIANMFPDLSHLLGAQQQYLLRLLRDPAHAAGYSRWGVKEVRLAGDDLRYLTTLFPRAKVLVVHRDPRHAWASYRATGFHAYRAWPEQRIDTVREFARNWAELATTLPAAAERGDALVLRYEELAEDDTLEAIAEHLRVHLDRSTVERRVGGAGDTPPLSRHEVRTIDRLAGPALAALGYDRAD